MSYLRRPIKARNSWLARPMMNRAAIICGVMLHSTRSLQEDGDDGPRTEGWWSNPQNIVRDSPPWGSYADLLLFEDGTQVVATDWDLEFATWTAGFGDAGTWAAGHYYLQIEIAQGKTMEAFKEAQIDSLAQFVGEMANRYDFPIARIPYLAQVGTPPRGICTHEASANGRKSGKTDPGPMFPWDVFLAKAESYRTTGQGVPEEDELSAEDVARIGALETELSDVKGRFADLMALIDGNPGGDPPEGWWPWARQRAIEYGADGGPEQGMYERLIDVENSPGVGGVPLGKPVIITEVQ